MVNRNVDNGTRIIVDTLLGDRRPRGYGVRTKSHNAVPAAVRRGRADWGVAIDTEARQYGLSFIPLQEERYDFAIPEGAGQGRYRRACARTGPACGLCRDR